MKLIRCYTRPENLNKIRQKLFDIGAPGLSVTEARGIGKPLSQMTTEKGNKPRDLPQFRERICVEVVTDDDSSEEIAEALADICRTGNLGDGKIFIWTIDEAIRIRTGERGRDSLY